MTGRISSLKETKFSGLEGWGYPLSISLIAHGALIVAILWNDSEISEPVLPKAFKVEIITEQKSRQQEAIPERSKNFIQSSSASNLKSDKALPVQNLKSPSPGKTPKKKKSLHVLKKQGQKAEIHIYAPLPKHKPVLVTIGSNNQNIEKPRLQQLYTDRKSSINSDVPAKQKIYPEKDKSTKGPFLLTPTNLKAGGPKTPVIQTIPPRPDSEANNPYPQYPNRARRRGLEGGLILRVTVNIRGKPSAIEVIKTSGHKILDNAAVKAVRNWQFQPAKKGEKPVKASVNLPVKFRLGGHTR